MTARVNAGVPAGGQFASEARAESTVSLTSPTPAPAPVAFPRWLDSPEHAAADVRFIELRDAGREDEALEEYNAAKASYLDKLERHLADTPPPALALSAEQVAVLHAGMEHMSAQLVDKAEYMDDSEGEYTDEDRETFSALRDQLDQMAALVEAAHRGTTPAVPAGV